MRLFAFVVVVAVTACFSDAPSLADESTTGGGGCSVGSTGCSCTGGRACDPGLECHAPSQLCFDPECERGSVDCPCLNFECVGALVCIDGYCQVPSGGSMDASASNSSPSESTAVTVGTDPPPLTSDDSMSGSVSDASADSASTDGSATNDDGATSSSTTGELSCQACLDDVKVGPCVAQWATCQGCESMYACVAGGTAVGECCADYYPKTIDWDVFASCANQYCSTPCRTIHCSS